MQEDFPAEFLADPDNQNVHTKKSPLRYAMLIGAKIPYKMSSKGLMRTRGEVIYLHNLHDEN